MDPRKRLGFESEQRARIYLESCGYRFVTQNFRCGPGEIDLIFIDQNQLVFVEVKFRTCDQFNTALEAVTPRKISKILHTAELFMDQNPQLPQSVRLDVIAIDDTKNPPLEHLKNVSI
jgi:putative endonuclease